ncbi:hypothetical protein DEA98_10200 [Brucella pseudogrignonensis]|uniref:Uncharacterized protein n=2 Tax=Brucella TaxID=234 RepID=A0A7Y3T6X4_9HYPH|nr:MULTISPECIES: hypothetical protein [Brucella]KAB2666052.1 hypothetical protein F9K91_07935 [Brucella tritici]MCM0751568.1 hypothetical protein [Brucella pseudogrignonensis]NNV22038.1 hypothetical protein [Brucella pseudogrignonensis]
MNIILGNTYADKITGFKGVATGHCEYITGCAQTLLQPVSEDTTKKPEGCWFDDQRLDHVTEAAQIVIDNGSTPGCDIPAPVR